MTEHEEQLERIRVVTMIGAIVPLGALLQWTAPLFSFEWTPRMATLQTVLLGIQLTFAAINAVSILILLRL
jgi:hypothetical protein